MPMQTPLIWISLPGQIHMRIYLDLISADKDVNNAVYGRKFTLPLQSIKNKLYMQH